MLILGYKSLKGLQLNVFCIQSFLLHTFAESLMRKRFQVQGLLFELLAPEDPKFPS